MAPVVAVIAPGMMGAGVGGRLVENGVRVLTSLKGRSEETAARAKAAGMIGAGDEEIAAADFILSILPPGDAVALAERFAPALQASNAKPVYVDCNAINPKTVDRVAAALAATECPFVDAGIIGSPPPPLSGPPPRTVEERVKGSPRLYASGPAAPWFATLREYGLDVRVLQGALSTASAMKMSYAGITKGTQAIGAAMMLAATRAGTADELFKELASSQKEMFAWFKRGLNQMPPKAYRWVAEMHEIAGFVGEDPTARELYEGAAHFYERIAEDFSGDKKDVEALKAFLGKDAQSR
jgi:3-hydroxyisobutyrate dehydrogenase-like beta-hydroxyacid dehydrogenase